MMLLITFAAYVALCVAAAVPSYHDDIAWKEYKELFGKIYSSGNEEQMRYDVWKRAVEEINLHNVKYGETYEQGMNEFTDMTDEEYKQYYTGLLPEHMNDTALTSNIHESVNNAQLPDSVDWVKKGLVTEVKNQGHCGSCYSFAATGALEGAWFKKTGHLISMSEQQILDCSYGTYHNRGCHGGWFQFSWKYIRDAGGEDSEQSYKYEAKKGECCFKSSAIVAKVTGYKNVKAHSEEALQDAVANVGPVAVALDASHASFRRYKSGVYYEPACSPRALVHAVLAVGYGSEEGKDYWLVKNSWGEHWGLSGYIKMARNKNNHCGIATRPAYPLV